MPTAISIHALLAESDCTTRIYSFAISLFLSTLSLRRATPKIMINGEANKFLSTLSLRRATTQKAEKPDSKAHFYPRSPCGERPKPCTRLSGRDTISIHALLAESDSQTYFPLPKPSNFYPRSPCGERRCCPSCRPSRRKHFYPRSPCGERLAPCRHHSPHRTISIHALLAESDSKSLLNSAGGHVFLSTLSLRRATKVCPDLIQQLQFLSTLSLRRATVHALKFADTMLFLSTLSLRRATNSGTQADPVKSISIHALLAESD